MMLRYTVKLGVKWKSRQRNSCRISILQIISHCPVSALHDSYCEISVIGGKKKLRCKMQKGNELNTKKDLMTMFNLQILEKFTAKITRLIPLIT